MYSKKLFAVVLILITLTGCGKIKEASDTMKAVTKTVEAAKDMAKSADSMAKSQESGVAQPLSEKEVRLYYSEIAGIRTKYPEIEFQSPVTAALQAVTEGKDLEKIITSETALDFDQYTNLSTRLLTVMATSAAAGMSGEMITAMESGIAEMENYDTSEMSDEQRQAFADQVAEQKKALAEAKEAADNEEFTARKDEFEMVMRIREEMGF